MAANDLTLLKGAGLAGNGWTWLKMTGNGWELLEIAINLLEMAGMADWL